MNRAAMLALAAALEQWGVKDDVYGTAHDGRNYALVTGRCVNHCLIFDEPVVLESPLVPTFVEVTL